jgi:alkanesulfonate monooxygenase SsuD/methylene tetrahydromethanopterin reductase-like flavin-dependent oxidoreductase (luciferase family)
LLQFLLVVIPTDSATREQRAKYEEYARERTPRTAAPRGPARMMFAPDLVGTCDEIAERLCAHAAFREIDEVTFALPFTFDHDDYVQILTDIATRLGPRPGWQPSLCIRHVDIARGPVAVSSRNRRRRTPVSVPGDR